MASVPNQRIIHINRERVTTDFLGIKNENWQSASRILGAHALRLYLYLASNANNFDLALSPAALEAAIGMPRSTYHDQFRKLVNLGYLVPKSGNIYDFYETPHLPSKDKTTDGYNFENDTTFVKAATPCEQQKSSEDIEINKTDKIINNEQEKQVSPAISKEQFIF